MNCVKEVANIKLKINLLKKCQKYSVPGWFHGYLGTGSGNIYKASVNSFSWSNYKTFPNLYNLNLWLPGNFMVPIVISDHNA